MEISINWVAVLVAAVASMVVGSVWYGPLFGKMFMRAMGMDIMTEEQKAQMKKGMTKTYIVQFVASVVTFCVLGWFISTLGMSGAKGGMEVAFWVWLGFVAPIKLGDAIWGGNMKLFWLGIGNMLVTLLVAGAILGGWQ